MSIQPNDGASQLTRQFAAQRRANLLTCWKTTKRITPGAPGLALFSLITSFTHCLGTSFTLPRERSAPGSPAIGLRRWGGRPGSPAIGLRRWHRGSRSICSCLDHTPEHLLISRAPFKSPDNFRVGDHTSGTSKSALAMRPFRVVLEPRVELYSRRGDYAAGE